MKKFFITLVCAAAALTPAFGQDAAETTPNEVITEQGGIYTIADNFNTGETANPNMLQSGTKDGPTGSWSVEAGAAVEYICYRANYTYEEPYGFLRTLATEGAYLQMTLPEYNCQKISFNSYKSKNGGVYYLYAGETKIGEITVNAKNNTGNFEFDIEEPYQAAGTVYKLVAQVGTDGTTYGRFNMLGITYTCTKTNQEKWEMPTCNIPTGAWIKAGTLLKFSCQEGGTIKGSIRYAVNDENGKAGAKIWHDFEGTSYQLPTNMGNGYDVNIEAYVTGGENIKSETLKVDLKINGDKFSVISSAFTGVEYSDNTFNFKYSLTVVNFDLVSPYIRLTITNLDTNAEESKDFEITRPESEFETYAEEEADTESEYMLPETISNHVSMELKDGHYRATMGYMTNASSNPTAMKYIPADAEDATAKEAYEFYIKDNGTTVGIENVTVSADETPVYYNLSGNRVVPAKGMGVLIRVAGGKAIKIVM